MKEIEGLTHVNSVLFDKFIKETPNLTQSMGYCMHSTVWKNEKGETVAFLETSSLGAATIYMIEEKAAGLPDCNRETINILSSIINKKS